ncbi:MAG: hypothetical protein PUA82_03735 [Eubacteriales bacterium]|nr:hypothetical protein [Eubacteriales bacterium]
MGEINIDTNLTGGNDQGTNGADSGRTFTQGELDAAIEKRLAREKEKYADYKKYSPSLLLRGMGCRAYYDSCFSR